MPTSKFSEIKNRNNQIKSILFKRIAKSQKKYMNFQILDKEFDRNLALSGQISNVFTFIYVVIYCYKKNIKLQRGCLVF